MSVENVNPQEELKRLNEQIAAATELAALKPIYFRLNEIIQGFPGDFDVQFSGNDVKQHLMARGAALKQQDAPQAPPPTTAAAEPPQPAAPPPETVMPAPGGPSQASGEPVATPLPFPFFESTPPPETIPPVSAAPPQQPFEPTATATPLPFSFFESAPPPPETLAPVAPPAPYYEGAPQYEAAPPQQFPPAAPMVPPGNPPQAPTGLQAPPVPPRPPKKGNPAVLIVAVVALLLASVGGFFVFQQVKKRNAKQAALQTTVQVDIATTPPGAMVKVVPAATGASGGKEASCTSNCKLALAPGMYQVSAALDGFEPAAGAVTVAGKQASVSLTLQPQAQSVRVLTDLDQGRVVIDGGPAIDLEEGQLVMDKLVPGAHTVKVTGQNGDASFSFQTADAQMPVVTGPVTAHSMIALLVASFGKQARVVTSAGPWKLTVNGQAQSDAGPTGTDIAGFRPGVDEIVAGEGPDQRNMIENFGSAPMLTAFLKTDVNAGTLTVSAGQDDARVFLNDKEYRKHTQHGQLRVQILGKVTVRVAKSGFEDAPAQTVEVKKGAEVRLKFDLKPQPKFSSLEIRGAIAGTEVFIDQRNAGAVGADGSVVLADIQPGEHTIELRREQYTARRLQRSFHAGQTVELAGADVVLAAAGGSVRLTRNPASATITYRRNDETESHEAHGNQIELPPGSYTFSAGAPGFAEATIHVQLAAGDNREVGFNLVARAATPPPVAAGGMSEFEDAQGWKQDGGNWVHAGGGFVPYKLPPKGVFTFTVALLKGGGTFRAGQIRWCVGYIDSKNYLLYEIDRKNFWAGVIEKGKRLERVKAPHNLGNQKAYTIQIEVAPDRLVQRVRAGNEWKVLDTFVEPGRDFTQGKFGFLIQGNDEIAISDFKFVPR